MSLYEWIIWLIWVVWMRLLYLLFCRGSVIWKKYKGNRNFFFVSLMDYVFFFLLVKMEGYFGDVLVLFMFWRNIIIVYLFIYKNGFENKNIIFEGYLYILK